MRASDLTILAFALSTLAAPTPEPQTAVFSAKQVRNDKHVANGPLAMAKTFRKFGKEVPQNIKDGMCASNTVLQLYFLCIFEKLILCLKLRFYYSSGPPI